MTTSAHPVLHTGICGGFAVVGRSRSWCAGRGKVVCSSEGVRIMEHLVQSCAVAHNSRAGLCVCRCENSASSQFARARVAHSVLCFVR